jgi:hypothetical protein
VAVVVGLVRAAEAQQQVALMHRSQQAVLVEIQIQEEPRVLLERMEAVVVLETQTTLLAEEVGQVQALTVNTATVVPL